MTILIHYSVYTVICIISLLLPSTQQAAARIPKKAVPKTEESWSAIKHLIPIIDMCKPGGKLPGATDHDSIVDYCRLLDMCILVQRSPGTSEWVSLHAPDKLMLADTYRDKSNFLKKNLAVALSSQVAGLYPPEPTLYSFAYDHPPCTPGQAPESNVFVSVPYIVTVETFKQSLPNHDFAWLPSSIALDQATLNSKLGTTPTARYYLAAYLHPILKYVASIREKRLEALQEAYGSVHCPICDKTVKTVPFSKHCKKPHLLCQTCKQEWLKQSGATCPVCRAKP